MSIPVSSPGADATVVQDINTGDEEEIVITFDVSSIPAGADIIVNLEFYVDAEGQGFNMHRMLATWDEAVTYTSIGSRHFAADDVDAESAVNVNWPGDDGYTGTITLSIPTATIQDWIDGNLVNNGWLMIATHASDGQQLRTREHATQADRPKLIVTYSAGAPELPADPVATTATGISSSGFTANWDAAAGADDYRLDVATDNGFTSIVTGYDDLTVAGTSQTVMGLDAKYNLLLSVRSCKYRWHSGNSNVDCDPATFDDFSGWLRQLHRYERHLYTFCRCRPGYQFRNGNYNDTGYKSWR